MLKWFSLTTSVLGLSVQPFLWKSFSTSTSFGSSFLISFTGTTAAMVVLTPVLVNLVTKRYVTQLHFREDDKTFVLHSLSFFNRKKTTEFKAEQVNVPAITGPFTTFTVFGRPFFVDPLSFNDMSAYEHLMGYDKLDAVGRPLENKDVKQSATDSSKS